LVNDISNDINSGKGTVNVLLKDKEMAENLNKSIRNIEQGTQSFNENMNAIKHNFLFRGYFKKLERKKKSQSNTSLNIK
jgi:phospholipid/cholesterol/gamma-HCH transport system substrate-binding protein